MSAVKGYMKDVLSAFSWLAKFHQSQGGKNVIGQMIQNFGHAFRLGDEILDGVRWRAKRKETSKAQVDKGQAAWKDWQWMEALSSKETQQGRLFIAYSIAQFASKMAWRDFFTGMFFRQAFPNAENWDTWAKDNNFAIIYREKETGKVISEFVPPYEFIVKLAEACDVLTNVRGYASIDDVSSREAYDIDSLLNG